LEKNQCLQADRSRLLHDYASLGGWAELLDFKETWR